ncbi:MAG TPA: pyridoxamine 5'-phosphate oxidase family protein [Thermoleophilaceae bacterium]|nr:pyridoxamine 5'-phosphate oxidase family protein [Thermoleophilaceae bacterium]
MHETADDMRALQTLLDESYERAGAHLRRITTRERRVDAEQLVEELRGMCLLALATVTKDGRPIVGPVDGIFHRGSFHFGSAADSVRARHIRARPQVSATHVPREEFSVTVHGRAVPVEIRDASPGSFRRTLLEIYVPRYGDAWETDFLDGDDESVGGSPVYWRLEAERMFTFQMA